MSQVQHVHISWLLKFLTRTRHWQRVVMMSLSRPVFALRQAGTAGNPLCLSLGHFTEWQFCKERVSSSYLRLKTWMYKLISTHFTDASTFLCVIFISADPWYFRCNLKVSHCRHVLQLLVPLRAFFFPGSCYVGSNPWRNWPKLILFQYDLKSFTSKYTSKTVLRNEIVTNVMFKGGSDCTAYEYVGVVPCSYSTVSVRSDARLINWKKRFSELQSRLLTFVVHYRTWSALHSITLEFYCMLRHLVFVCVRARSVLLLTFFLFLIIFTFSFP
jgi:hypothetical protein